MFTKKQTFSRSKWNSINWNTLDEAPVVHATLNATTNIFDVVQPSEDWTKPQETKFSHKEPTATFRLNFDVAEQPVFHQVVDYNSFRDEDLVPGYDDLMICPEDTDFRSPAPNVPINQLKHPYSSVEKYLYTHYQLMKHDYLIPLRNAVKGYKEDYATIQKKEDMSLAMEKIQSFQKPFRIYEHVQLNAIVFGSRQPLYRISFRLPYYVRVQWAQSKRLMPGTLVLLSKDHFESDLKVATIVERGDDPMRGSSRFEFMLDLYLERDNEDLPLGFGDPMLSDKSTYVMIEAVDGYFEAYRHVLKVLQNTQDNQLPFSPYIVNLSKEILVPHYAAKKRTYNINVNRKSRYDDCWPVDIMGSWPEYQTRMDKTQLDALKTILSRNLSIIQGPPGTGKTYVGTYAMRVLLDNYDESLGPIVCICQTNHALDQFLEHVLEHNDNIVRIGGRSKSELLKLHTMYEIKKDHERPRGMGRMYRSRDDLIKKIKEVIIELYETPCVTADFVESIQGLRPRQMDSLKRGTYKEKQMNTQATTLSDSDDDWEITSVETSIRKLPPKNNRNSGKTQGKNGNKQDFWAGGNPNFETKSKEKEINPIEIWLRDAIEVVTDENVDDFMNDKDRDLLEQTKGLVFEDMVEDENEVIDEERLKEIRQDFKGDEQEVRDRNFSIPIGKFYRRLTEVELGEQPGRKIVNYKSVEKTNRSEFDFFGGSQKDDEFGWSDNCEGNNNDESVGKWMREDDMYMWPLSARLKLHKKWIELRNINLETTLRQLMDRYTAISKDIRTVTIRHEAKICRQNRVVGMTGTAAAKYHDLLEEMRPRIMVVEEAAEMLESHIISALTGSLEHLILIGDHQQLRPSTAVHKLAEVHGLSVSLFERLIMNNFPFTRLSHQRRMRSEIRQLIDPIYRDPPLQDHPMVETYPTIKGMAQPLFFLSHNEHETSLADSASKINEHEAKIAAKLSFYLIQQGYESKDITIITMYAGQKSILRRFLREERRALTEDIDKIQISSVDGYQGEENKIIILSLVRSNTNGQIGFLKAANRVCVALSRAKQGMYILGNANLLCDRSELWNEIVVNLEERSNKMIGTRLPLKCTKHATVTQIQWAVDFVEVEEGGCSRPCKEPLECGHQCELRCHPFDHSEVQCKQPCGKILECRHACVRRCYEKCGPCLSLISVRLPCGHLVENECNKIRSMARAPAGHRCPECNAPLKQ